MDESYIRFDESKFIEVVHFVCANAGPDALGNVKLHKILYFADMLHFSETGRALTGVDYQKQQFGPVARHLTKALKTLQAQGKIKTETKAYFGFEKKQYVSIKLPATKLSNSETDLLQEMIGFVCGQSAKAISDLSHNLAWEVAELGERIPYAAVEGWRPVEVKSRDIDAAVSEARRIRPQIEALRRESRVF
jgi:uncharacterized phage-associated protein